MSAEHRDLFTTARHLNPYFVRRLNHHCGSTGRKAYDSLLHVAVAVVNGIEYLLTWNYKHLANAGMRSKIETTCRELGYEAVIICTPEELMEV